MNGCVFIADHQPNNVGVLASLLRQDGYEVQIATTGQDAIDAIATAPPDVVLLKIDLPDIPGVDVCKQLDSAPRVLQD